MENKYFHNYNFFDISNEPNFDTSTLILLNNFITLQQTHSHTCGARCVEMLLKYIFKNDVNNYLYSLNENDLAKILGTKKYYGTNITKIYKFLLKHSKKNKYVVKSSVNLKMKNNKTFQTFAEFKNFVLTSLKNNSPIIVENSDYGGHYRIIIGYDDLSENGNSDVLIFADPFDYHDGLKDGYNYSSACKFFFTWFDSHCFSKKNRLQPFVTIEKQK